VFTVITIFAGIAVPGSGTGGVMIFYMVTITGKSSSKGSNRYHSGNGNRTFHKGDLYLRVSDQNRNNWLKQILIWVRF